MSVREIRMKKLALTILLFAASAAAQVGNPGVTYVSSAPSGACSQSPPVQVLNSSGAIYTCNNGTWAVQGGTGTPSLNSPGQPTYTFWVTGPLLLQQSAGSGYSGSGTCALSGGVLVSGSADTCTATQSGGGITFAIVGTGIYSVWPQVVLGGVTGGTGAEAQAYNDPANTTIYARREATGTVTNGTDAAVFVTGILNAQAGRGGNFYFKNGLYPINSYTAETTSGWTAYYYAIGIPAGTTDNNQQWIFQGEARPEWNWGNSNNFVGAKQVQNNGVVFVSSSTAEATVTSSDMIMNWWQRPNGAYQANEDKFSNMACRFSGTTRGNETCMAMWMTSAPEYNNVECGINLPGYTISNGSAPTAGTLGSFGCTGSYGSFGLPQVFHDVWAYGYNVCFDWNEHTISDGTDDAELCNYPFEIGRGGPNAPGGTTTGIAHGNYIARLAVQENLHGGILGPALVPGSRIDMPLLDDEIGASGYWYSGRTNGGMTEVNPGNTVGNIDYTIVQAGTTTIIPAPPLFTSGGTSLCINGTTPGCSLPLTYNFLKVENPLSLNGNFTTSDSTGTVQVTAPGVAEPSSTGNGYGIYTGLTWPTNQYSSVKVLTLSSGSDYLVLYTNVTSLATENAYQMNITGGYASLNAVVAGTTHTIVASTAITVNSGDVLLLKRTGISPAVLTLTRNGTQVFTYTDSTYGSSITAGSPGFNLYAPTTITTIQISSWTGGTVN